MRYPVLVAAAMVLGCVSTARSVDIETVPIHDPGNPDDTHGVGFGRVDYVYHIGAYEVTAGQYTEFLNAVAADDTYELYSQFMWTTTHGCKIQRTGTPGNYIYSVDPAWADRPVNDVSWGDAARFANWLHNGQPTGAQDLTTTEDGSYLLDGAMSNAELLAVVRRPDATWVIPSEDEWYKAAYHKNDGVTGAYFDYPTSSDDVPGYVNDNGNLSGTGGAFTEGGIDPGNYATSDEDGGTDGIGAPYYRTRVGEWEESGSPYGTFDQAGNVSEWNEVVLHGLVRGLRGGTFYGAATASRAASSSFDPPTFEDFYVGFRVAEVPVSAPADLDGDGVVTADDHALFSTCLGGPDVLDPPAGCLPLLFHRADVDGDGNVDLVDHAWFTDFIAPP